MGYLLAREFSDVLIVAENGSTAQSLAAQIRSQMLHKRPTITSLLHHTSATLVTAAKREVETLSSRLVLEASWPAIT